MKLTTLKAEVVNINLLKHDASQVFMFTMCVSVYTASSSNWTLNAFSSHEESEFPKKDIDISRLNENFGIYMATMCEIDVVHVMMFKGASPELSSREIQKSESR